MQYGFFSEKISGQGNVLSKRLPFKRLKDNIAMREIKKSSTEITFRET